MSFQNLARMTPAMDPHGGNLAVFENPLIGSIFVLFGATDMFVMDKTNAISMVIFTELFVSFFKEMKIEE